ALERERDAQRDPVVLVARFLLAEGLLSERELEKLRQEVDTQVTEAADRALGAALPAPGSALELFYSPDVDPTSSAFSTEPRFAEGTSPTTMVNLLNACMRDEMKRDPRIV